MLENAQEKYGSAPPDKVTLP